MKKPHYHVAVYGIVTLGGGVHGFVSKGSLPSLIAGSVLGLLLLAGARGMVRNEWWGWWLSLLSVLALLGRFVPAFTTSGSAYPHGLMATLGIWVLGVLVTEALVHPPGLPNLES